MSDAESDLQHIVDRPIYEGVALATWVGAAIASTGIASLSAANVWPIWWAAGFAGGMGGLRGYQTMKVMNRKFSLVGKGICFITTEEMLNRAGNSKENVWMGKGFTWAQQHAQASYDMLRVDPAKIPPPDWMRNLYNKYSSEPLASKDARGLGWIHGIESREEDIILKLADFEGHTQILGTNGSGKTRLLELLVTHAIHRGDVVIAVDPKYDTDLIKRMKKESERAGRNFFKFSTVEPSTSCRIDALANFSEVSQLATRLASLLTSQPQLDNFVAFSWTTMNNIAQALYFLDSRTTIQKIRQSVEGGVENIMQAVLETHFTRVVPDTWQADVAPIVTRLDKKNVPNPRLMAYIEYYEGFVERRFPENAVGGLLATFKHDREHFGKMIASLSPLLSMLTSGSLKDILSPDPFDITDERPITNLQRIIDNNGVLYVGTNSLQDKVTSNAVCSLLASDAAATAGAIYGYKQNEAKRRVTLIIDEANVALNEALVEILNKGRGAGIDVIMSTQTVADYTSKLGSLPRARQVMGNCNNILALRTIDDETQDFVVGKIFVDTWIRSKQTSFTSTSSTEKAFVHYSGGVSQRESEALLPAFPPRLLGKLPNWQYVASFSGKPPIKGRVPILRD